MDTKKQESWFHTDVDFENSFKYWFALQWQNWFIHIFIISFGLVVSQLYNINEVIFWVVDAWHESVGAGIIVTLGTFLPLIVTFVVTYKGFWQYFNDLKNGISR